jgi:threonine dehydrogenase-like Zn-dependent dehydrogenase
VAAIERPARRGGELNAATTAVRAAVVTAPRRAELTTVRLGDLDRDSLRVEVEGCGVCGSSLPTWEGRPWFSYPLEPGALGHEAWGRVIDRGPEVGAGSPAVGARVAFLCETAFAEVVDVPARLVVGLPDAVQGPFPGEALACGFNVAARSGFGPDQVVAVVGMGFLGTIVAALAAEAGAHVIAMSRRESALELARTMGAKEAVTLGVHDPVAAVERLTEGGLCDVVVEAVGAQEPLDLAAKLTKVRGRLVVAGFHQDGPRSVDLQMLNWRGIDVVNAHERDDELRLAGIRAAADAVASGRLDPTPLYTHHYPLGQLAQALDAMAERPDGFMKALVTR